MTVKKFLTVIQVLLICLFLACAAYLGKYFFDLSAARRGYEELRREVRAKTYEDASGAYEEQYEGNGVLVRYDELYQKNNDFCGWLQIPDTGIDYPVVQGEDNEFYLNHDFYRNKQTSGIPFVDADCNENSSNIIIYAHNMKDGSMFAPISKYLDREFLNSHSTVFYDTLTEHREYEIFSVFRTTVGSGEEFRYNEFADIQDEEIFNEYVLTAEKMSLHNTGVSPAWGDSLLTLSTCAYNTRNERLVVCAVKKN